MQALDIKDDGTTTIQFTDAEAHALRDDLAKLKGSDAAWTLFRLLGFSHGEPGEK
jgi:hypothetical protein